MKKLFSMLLLVMFVGSLSAQSGAQPTGSLLWKVSGKGLKKPSYLFGTNHFIPHTFLDNVSGVREAFDKSEQVVGELLVGDAAALTSALQAAGMMPSGYTWKTLLSEAEYAFVDKQLEAIFGAGLQAFENLNPAMIHMYYTANSYRNIFPDLNEGESLDVWFQIQANAAGKQVIGLESVDDQLYAIFKSTSIRDQAALLLCVLRNPEKTSNEVRQLDSLYRKADFAGLADMWNPRTTDCPISEEYQKALVDYRNNNWMKRLPSLMSEKSSFIAVGAMHLVGETGLIQSLRRLGYTVEAVK